MRRWITAAALLLATAARADDACLLTVEQFAAYKANIEAQRDKARAAAATFEGAAQLVVLIATNATATAAAGMATPTARPTATISLHTTDTESSASGTPTPVPTPAPTEAACRSTCVNNYCTCGIWVPCVVDSDCQPAPTAGTPGGGQ